MGLGQPCPLIPSLLVDAQYEAQQVALEAVKERQRAHEELQRVQGEVLKERQRADFERVKGETDRRLLDFITSGAYKDLRGLVEVKASSLAPEDKTDV
jgi:hypothetical protein